MPKVAHLALLTLCLISSAGALAAQGPITGDGEIRGVVLSRDGQPLAGAEVQVRSAADSMRTRAAVTDAAGAFRVRELARGEYSLRIRHLGYAIYQSGTVSVTGSSATVDAGPVRLAPVALELEGVDVTGQRSPMIIGSDRTVYSTRDMPASAGGVATDLLRSVPELQVDIDGSVSHRGAAPQIHIDGRPAPVRGEALGQFLQQFPANRIERIEVIPNPSARFDAEGPGGIVNIVLKQNAGLGVSGNVAGNLGTKGRRGASGRLAYQQGPITLFGGVSASIYDRSIVNLDLREHLLASPVTLLEREQHGSNEISFGSTDVSVEVRLDSQTVLWSSGSGSLSGYDWGGTWYNTVLDAERLPMERYDRSSESESLRLTTDLMLGLKRALGGSGHELSGEIRRTSGGYDKDGRYGSTWFEVPGYPVSGIPDRRDHEDRDDNTVLTFQTDYVRPLPRQLQLQIGYRGSLRNSDTEALQRIYVPTDASSPVGGAENHYTFREELHAGYLMLGRTFGRMQTQAGARLEQAATRFALPSRAESFDNDYANVFPSANVGYDFGRGIQGRATFSKRIERPGAAMLNPYDPIPDPVNRRVGNPDLDAQYTDAVTLDISWSGQMGILRFSPYMYRTTDGWESIKEVDQAGFSTITWENFASIRSYGTSATASLQPSRPLSGSLTFNTYYVKQDASNVSADFSGDDLRWSANVSTSARLGAGSTLQARMNVYSERDAGQVRIGRIIDSSVSLRQQLWNEKVAVNFLVNDPFDLYRNGFITRDASHVQSGRTRWSYRMATLSVSYDFGRTPRSERRVQSSDSPRLQEVQVEIR
jgi:hypothetical protein